jgi:hypothetical protein
VFLFSQSRYELLDVGVTLLYRQRHTVSYDSNTEPIFAARAKGDIIGIMFFIRKE